MTLLHFLQVFLLSLVTGALAISGWYFITRGRIETLPDGTKEKRGMIFSFWYFFWTRTAERPRRIYYTGDQLMALYKDLSRALIGPAGKSPNLLDKIEVFYSSVKLHNYDYWKASGALDRFSEAHEVGLVYKGDGYVSIYKEVDEYVFPVWLRKPLATCPTCFAGVYGTLFYFAASALAGDGLYAWATAPAFAFFFFWVVFCMALAVLNTAITQTFHP